MKLKHRSGGQRAVVLIEDNRPLLEGLRLLRIPQDPSALAPTRVRMNAQERELTGLIAAGFDDDEIASRLGMDAESVSAHVESILAKLRLRSHLELTAENRVLNRRVRKI